MSLVDSARMLKKEAADYTVGNIQRNWKDMQNIKARKARNKAAGDPGMRYRSAKATSDKLGKKIARRSGLKGALAGTVLGVGASSLASRIRNKDD